MDEINTTSNFIYDFIDEDLANGVNTRIQTRFPPEPNGYLHIGHAKAICIDFATAEKYGGECNLRLDDTNPSKEDVEYVEAIKEDIEWLGFKWNKVLYASSYFDFIYECAIKLISFCLLFSSFCVKPHTFGRYLTMANVVLIQHLCEIKAYIPSCFINDYCRFIKLLYHSTELSTSVFVISEH